MLHAIALACLAAPVIGVRFIPSVDLPDHLATVRVWSEYLHGEHADILKSNYSPAYKPFFVIALGVYELLSTNRDLFPSTVVIVMTWLAYLLAINALRILSQGSTSKELLSIAAGFIAMQTYSLVFGWGLASYVSAVPFAILAASCLVRWMSTGETRWFLGFVGTSTFAHICHPIVTLYLGLFLLPAVVLWVPGAAMRREFKNLLWMVSWPIWVVVVHRLTFDGGATLSHWDLIEKLFSPLHTWQKAQGFMHFLWTGSTWNPLFSARSFPFVSVGIGASLLALGFGALKLYRSSDQPFPQLIQRNDEIFRNALVAILTAIVFVSVRHDLFAIHGPGWAWFEVRGSSFVIPFLSTLLLASALATIAKFRLQGISFVFGALIVVATMARATDLREQFIVFENGATSAYEQNSPSATIDLPVTLDFRAHFFSYHCVFDESCTSFGELWFAKLPKLSIYPISPIH